MSNYIFSPRRHGGTELLTSAESETPPCLRAAVVQYFCRRHARVLFRLPALYFYLFIGLSPMNAQQPHADSLSALLREVTVTAGETNTMGLTKLRAVEGMAIYEGKKRTRIHSPYCVGVWINWYLCYWWSCELGCG